MRHTQKRVRLFEEKEVFVVDKTSPLYGAKLVVDFFLADGTPLFKELLTGANVELSLDQISEEPPNPASESTK